MTDAEAHPARTKRPTRIFAAFLWLLLVNTGCAGYTYTERLVDGERIDSRPIASAAYADYLRGAYLEAQGRHREALLAYRDALRRDHGSAEIQTRIAKLSCLLGSKEANTEFSDAISKDGNYEPAWREWSHCAMNAGQSRQALHFARRAQAVAPDAFSATSILVDALEARGSQRAARAQLLAFVTRNPQSVDAWRRLLEFARENHDAAWEWEARQQLAFRMPQSEVAILAAERAYFVEAREQAMWLLRADETATDARIAGLFACFMLADQACFTELLKVNANVPWVASDRAVALYDKLLEHRVGEAALMAQGP
jgi:tetratricopeptide (TPR) repeat protein